MKPLSFELHYSLMDRFIHTFNSKANPQIADWILKGSKSKLWEKRAEWFDYETKLYEWGLNNADEDEFQKEVTEAIYLVFAILGNESEEDEYKGVSKIFNDIVRLAVLDKEQDITTYSKYSTCIRSSEMAFKYLLHRLGFVENKEYTHKAKGTETDEKRFSVQLRGEDLNKDKESGNLKDITFQNVCWFLEHRLKALDEIKKHDRHNKPYKHVCLVSNTIMRLKNIRNEESHRAFYTDPEKYWNRLVYMLFDYITITFYLRRYLKVQVQKLRAGTNRKLYSNEDLGTVESALGIADNLIKESEEINVRFQYQKAESRQEKLLISECIDKQSVNDIGYPKEEMENGKTICYYDKILIRSASYGLQSYEVQNGKDVAIGKRLELKASLLFDGAVVQLTMPTKKVPYPSIDEVIARTTGLIEDSEYRDIIEKVLTANIPDEEFRSKLRVLLLLDEGDKEAIIKKFIDENKSVKPAIMSDEFKSFIDKQCDENLQKLESLFEDLQKSLKSNQDDLKDFISDAVGNIDLRSILDSNNQIKNEISELRQWIRKWCKKQEKISKKNAHSAQEMQQDLKDAIKSSSVNTISQLKKIFQSETNKWRKKINRKLNLILALIGTAITIVVIISVLYIFCWKRITYSMFDMFPSEWTTQQAVSHGNVMIVCRYANELEKKGDVEEANEWWAKNLKLMESLLQSAEDMTIKEYALENLVYQYLGGKGCAIDYKKALEYGKQLSNNKPISVNYKNDEESGLRLLGESKIALKAYLYALNGNYREALLLADKAGRHSFKTLQEAVTALNSKEGTRESADFEWADTWLKNIDAAMAEARGSLLTLEGLIMKGTILESEGDLYGAYENYHQAGLKNYTKGYIEEYRMLSENCPTYNSFDLFYKSDILHRYPNIATWHINEGLKNSPFNSFSALSTRSDDEVDNSKSDLGIVNSEISAAFSEVKYLYDTDKPFITMESIDNAYKRAKSVNDSIIKATGYVHMDFDSKFILSKLQAAVGKRYLEMQTKVWQDSLKFNIPVLPSLYEEYSSQDSTYISDLAEYFTLSNIISENYKSSNMRTMAIEQLRKQANKRISESGYADDLFVLEYGKLLSSQKSDESRQKGIHMIIQTFMRSSDEGIKWECNKVLLRDQLRKPLSYDELIQTIVNYVADDKGLKNCDLKKIEDIDTKQRVILRIAKALDVKSDYDLLGILWSYISILELSKDKVNEDKELFYHKLSEIGNLRFIEFMWAFRINFALENGHQDYVKRMTERGENLNNDTFEEILEKYRDTKETPTAKNNFIVFCPYIPGR